MAVRLGAVLWWCAVLWCCGGAHCKNLLQLIKEIPNLSMIAAVIEGDTVTNVLLQHQGYTAFLPTNEALANYTGPKDREFVNAHLSNTALLIEDLGATVTTTVTGNPELYITKVPNGRPAITGWEDHDYYVNNAKVSLANQRAVSEDSHEQVLHVLDEVLPPTRVQGQANVDVKGYPTAADVLLNYRAYGLTGDLSVGLFQQRVRELGQEGVYRAPGANTFFVPLDRGISDSSEVLDAQVIHGHVVPGHALFTRPTAREVREIESLAFTDNVKVLLKLEEVSSRPPSVYYVTSNTVASDQKHEMGTAVAQIRRANIPVANGVIHLIDRRLMTKAESILSYLKEEGGQLSEFHKLFHEHQQDLLTKLAVSSSSEGITLFAPNNHAFEMVKKESLEKVALNTAKLGELLRLHMVPGRLTTHEIQKQSLTRKFEAPTESRDRKLYFNVYESPVSGQPVVTVEGAGVNATVRTPNIVTSNGVIHIIDRIMDIPSQTVYEKLQSNPDISITYNLSSQDGFNAQFNNRQQKFTLFVPDDDAWLQVKKKMRSSYKKLVMGEFPYHVKSILERHMLVGRDLPLSALVALTNNGSLSQSDPNYRQVLNMTRGKVHFQPRISQASSDYYVEWMGVRARVVQGDVECVNGVLHIIDKVLMSHHDVTVAAAAVPPSATFLSTAAILLTAAVLR